MREFIVTNPNLSVGKPGDIVTAKQLRMTDEKLDEWVAAGYGVEVGGIPNPIEYADDIVEDDDWDEDPDAGEETWEFMAEPASGFQGIEEYDPEDRTVAEVKAFMDEHPEEAEEVRLRETLGKARSGILNYRVD